MDAGAAYAFGRSGADWDQQAYIKAPNTDAGDQFGVSVALSTDGATLVVGAPREDSAATQLDGNQADNSASDAGAAYVLGRSGITWSHRSYVKASNSGQGDQFGSAVTLSGDAGTLAIGASIEGSSATGIDGNQASDAAPGAGAVYVTF
jgi:hypothetical protein